MNAPDPGLRVRLEPSALELRVADAERLLDAIDDGPAAALPVACRAGNCGACLLAVREGADLLELPDLAERETLAAFGATPPGQRLGCQLRGCAGASGRIVLEIPARDSSVG